MNFKNPTSGVPAWLAQSDYVTLDLGVKSAPHIGCRDYLKK